MCFSFCTRGEKNKSPYCFDAVCSWNFNVSLQYFLSIKRKKIFKWASWASDIADYLKMAAWGWCAMIFFLFLLLFLRFWDDLWNELWQINSQWIHREAEGSGTLGGWLHGARVPFTETRFRLPPQRHLLVHSRHRVDHRAHVYHLWSTAQRNHIRLSMQSVSKAVESKIRLSIRLNESLRPEVNELSLFLAFFSINLHLSFEEFKKFQYIYVYTVLYFE